MKFGILLFDGVEPIDLAALGALSIARRFEPTIETCVISTGEHNKVTLACNVKIDAEFTIKDAPECDVYLIAGGPTWKEEIHREQTLEFIRSKSPVSYTHLDVYKRQLLRHGHWRGHHHVLVGS